MEGKRIKSTGISLLWAAVQGGLILGWAASLRGTDSDYAVYCFCAAWGLYCVARNCLAEQTLSRRLLLGLLVFSAGCSLTAMLANFLLFLPVRAPWMPVRILTAFLGGTCLAGNVLGDACRRFPEKRSVRQTGSWVFWYSFAAMAGISLLYHHCANWPGTFTPDSIAQLEQILTGTYNNTHPYYHTILTGAFFKLGMLLWGQVNAAAGFALDCQCLFLAACFAYTVMTLYQMGASRIWIALSLGFYGLGVYNVIYATTLWKDVLFGGFSLLFLTVLLRLLRGLGKNISAQYLLLAFSGAGFCLMRTNGWYAFAATAAVCLLILRKRLPGVLKVMAAVLVVCWILINPVLTFLGIPGTDPFEALAVPFQQLAYVVVENPELPEEDAALLSQAFDLEMIRNTYNKGCVDMVKIYAFRRENADSIQSNIGPYLKLYLRWALRYPDLYLKAWIWETRGFWAPGGYTENAFYSLYATEIHENDIGLQPAANPPRTWSDRVAQGMNALFRFQERSMKPLFAMGLAVWIVMGCGVLFLWKRRLDGVLCIPLLVLAVGLWLGAPVFSELRYAYPILVSLPLILAAYRYETKQPQME